MRRFLANPLAPTILALLAMTALAACGAGDDTSTTTPQSTTGNLEIADASPPSILPATPAPATPVGAVLEDGRHPVYLTDIDTPARTITLDLVQFLTGDEAKRVYAADHPEDPSGPPNDYYIVNDNPRLRTLPVVPGATVTVVWSEPGSLDAETISFGELADYFAQDVAPSDPYLWYDPFWLTVEDGRVVAMEEQYIP
ncbi:MAG: hypothetical protein ACRDUA_09610 [Micromonosporaceae bacterium]